MDAALHQAFGDDHPNVGTVVVRGRPAQVLISAAQGADLLVVGSRGHGALAGMLLGSVSEDVAAHAPCPVVVIRHHSAPTANTD
jgi:nucleotide-binding universal stress UspA family protein